MSEWYTISIVTHVVSLLLSVLFILFSSVSVIDPSPQSIVVLSLALTLLFIVFLIKGREILLKDSTTITVLIAITIAVIHFMLFSIEKTISFYPTLGVILLLLIYVFVSQNSIQHYAGKLLSLSVLYASYLLIASYCLSLTGLLQITGGSFLQFIYPLSNQHNHLGDFLGLSLLILLIDKQIKIATPVRIFSFIFLLIFFVMSYSRSAYLSFAITLIYFFFVHRKRWRSYYLFFCSVVLLICFFLAASLGWGYIRPILRLQADHIAQTIPYKSVFGKRDEYFSTVLKTFIQRPVGYGPGTFEIATSPFTNRIESKTQVAHNLFLEIAIAYGIFGLFFIGIPILLLMGEKVSNQTQTAPYLIYLFVLFQVDYVYLSFPLMIYFLTLLATHESKQKNRERSLTNYVGVGVVFLLCASVVILTAYIIQYKYGQFALKILPFDPYIIMNQLRTDGYPDNKNPLLNRSLDVQLNKKILIEMAYFYRAKNNTIAEYETLSRLCSIDKFCSYEIINRQYILASAFLGRDEADRRWRRATINLKNSMHTKQFQQYFNDIGMPFCVKNKIPSCAYFLQK